MSTIVTIQVLLDTQSAILDTCPVYSEAYEVLLQEWRFGLNGEQSALAAQLTADIFAKDKKGQWAAANPNEKRRKKKDYIPLARRRVPTLEAGGECQGLRLGGFQIEGK